MRRSVYGFSGGKIKVGTKKIQRRFFFDFFWDLDRDLLDRFGLLLDRSLFRRPSGLPLTLRSRDRFLFLLLLPPRDLERERPLLLRSSEPEKKKCLMIFNTHLFGFMNHWSKTVGRKSFLSLKSLFLLFFFKILYYSLQFRLYDKKCQRTRFFSHYFIITIRKNNINFSMIITQVNYEEFHILNINKIWLMVADIRCDDILFARNIIFWFWWSEKFIYVYV